MTTDELYAVVAQWQQAKRDAEDPTVPFDQAMRALFAAESALLAVVIPPPVDTICGPSRGKKGVALR